MIELMIQVFIEVGMTYWSQGNQLAAVQLAPVTMMQKIFLLLYRALNLQSGVKCGMFIGWQFDTYTHCTWSILNMPWHSTKPYLYWFQDDFVS